MKKILNIALLITFILTIMVAKDIKNRKEEW